MFRQRSTVGTVPHSMYTPQIDFLPLSLLDHLSGSISTCSVRWVVVQFEFWTGFSV